MRSTPAAVHYVVTTTSQTSTPRTSARCWRVQRRRPSMRDAGTTNTLNQPRSHLQVVLNDCKHNCGGTQTRREKLDDHTVDPMRTTAPYACATTCGREPAANYCARYWRARRRINVCRKKKLMGEIQRRESFGIIFLLWLLLHHCQGCAHACRCASFRVLFISLLPLDCSRVCGLSLPPSLSPSLSHYLSVPPSKRVRGRVGR
jgi:hypothetical protein